MCDERERLIGYVYDECDPSGAPGGREPPRECPTCRAGNRRAARGASGSARVGVPDHEPDLAAGRAGAREAVVAAGAAWAMAAAAAVLLVVGVLGGAATRLFFMPAAPAVTVASQPARVSPAELAAIKARVLATLRAEIESRPQQVVATRSRELAPQTPDPSVVTLAREVSELRAQQILLAENLMDDVKNISERQRTTDERSYMMMTSFAQGGLPAGGGR